MSEDGMLLDESERERLQAQQLMEGGRLLDSGLYGCIFTPQLRCKGKKEQREQEQAQAKGSPMLSKLISKETALLEHAIGERIRRIPLWRNYFAVSESICVPADRQTDRDVARCDPLKTERLQNFRVLSMRYGGSSLSNVRFRLNDFDLLGFVRHLLEAGAMLTLHGIVHRDIHSKNIIVDGHHVPRIIDFNLSIQNQEKAVAQDLAHQYSPTLMQLSPDYVLMNAVASTAGSGKKQGLSYEKVVQDVLYKRQFTKKLVSVLGFSMRDMAAKMEAFYAYMERKQGGQRSDVLLDWFHEFWPVIDSWAIGANVVQLISHLSQWPQFQGIWMAAKPKLLPVLRGLCAVHPLERMDCVEALHVLNPGNRVIAKFGVQWLMERAA